MNNKSTFGMLVKDAYFIACIRFSFIFFFFLLEKVYLIALVLNLVFFYF